MKPNITQQEYIAYNKKLKDIFSQYCIKNNLVITFYDNKNDYHTKKIIPKDVILVTAKSFSINKIDTDDFFKNHFDFFDENGKPAKHAISTIDSNVQSQKMWENINSLIDIKEQALFNKFMFQSHHPQTLINALKNMGDDRFWFSIKHMQPIGKSNGTKTEFDLIFPEIQKKTIDTAEKVESFYEFLKFMRNIAKREDKISLVCDLVSKKVDSKYHEAFAKILEKEIGSKKNATRPEDIMQEPRQSLTLVLNKNDYFEKIPVPHLKSINELNLFNRNIVHALKEADILEKLKLLDVEHIEFNSSSKTAKFIFEFSPNTTRDDLPEIFLNIVKACCNHYDDYRTDLKSTVKKTVDNYILNQKLEFSLPENESLPKTRKKI